MEITKKPKIIFYTKLGNEKNIRPAVTMGIFCAILSALILTLVHSIPLLLIIGIPAVLFVLICAAGFGLCCVRHSIECIELTGDFMILEYYKNSKELIKWDEIAGIEPFNRNPISKVMYFLHGNNRPVYTQLSIHLESGITMKIPLADFYDDELDTIVDMLASKVTRIPESGTGLSDHKIDFRTRKAEADTGLSKQWSEVRSQAPESRTRSEG